MNVFTKRNALVGFLTIKRLERRLRWKRRSRARRLAAVGLGVGSLVALAGLAVVLLRRHHGAEEKPAETDDEIVGEVVTPAAEPIPAT